MNPRRSISLLLALSLTVVLSLSAVKSFADDVFISGFTKAQHDSVLGLAVTGQVKKIHVQEGQAVRKGQTLLELDSRSEQLEKERRQLLAENSAELAAVRSQLETLARHYEATKELYETTGSVTREELENQELELALARIEIDRLEALKEREKLEVKIADNQLQKRLLLAPFSGTVAEIKTGSGENCETDSELLRLVDTTRVEFIANIELALSQQLKIGQQVTIQFQARNGPFDQPAALNFISPVVDPASGLRMIKAVFDNTDGKVIPGMAGELRLELSI